jgi:hypothetical protein
MIKTNVYEVASKTVISERVHYRVHKAPLLTLILRQINAVFTIISNLSETNFNIILLSAGLLNHSRWPTY